MKKMLSLLLVLVAVLSLAACGKSPAEETVSPNATIGEKLLFDFKQKVDSTESLEELANILVANEAIEFAPMVMPVEEGYLAGFDQEIHGFTEGVTFGPMIGSIPFVGYVFRTESEAAAAELVKTLDANANLSWNICVTADEKICQAVGSNVFFVMAPVAQG